MRLRDHIRYIIWDYNGTLLDDRWLCVRLINELLLTEGLKAISDSEYKHLFDFPVKEYYRKLGFPKLDERFDELGHRFINRYEQEVMACSLHSGAKTVLSALHDAGYQQSVLSARHRASLVIELKRHNIIQYFTEVAGLNNHLAHGKDHLAGELLSRVSFKPKEILLLGDTLHDAQIAAHYGFQCVLFAHGHFSEERLHSAGYPILGSVGALKEWLPI